MVLISSYSIALNKKTHPGAAASKSTKYCEANRYTTMSG
jgi:hypothetical protein